VGVEKVLSSLHIENIAVIKTADIDFGGGFTDLTGETGAGKSIIIDSINLILGGRVSRELIRGGCDSAMVSALFTDISETNLKIIKEFGIETDSGTLMLQRNITADGKSQTRLNGRVIPVTLQREIGKLFINIHGQHDNQALLEPSVHIDFLDAYADLRDIMPEYERYYAQTEGIKKSIAELTRGEKEKARLIELLKYQINDIDSAKLKNGEEENITTLRTKIQNYEKIQKQANIVYRALYRNEKGTSAYEMINRAVAALEQIDDVLPEASLYAEKLNGYKYEIEAIAESAHGVASDEYENPAAELNKIESRLDTISKLKRKYGADVAEVLDFREKSARELDDLELSDVKINELNATLVETEANARRIAEKITRRRIDAARSLEEKIMGALAYLEMGNVLFSVDIKPDHARLSKNGADGVEFLISTNPGETLKPLSKIASGGELSRIMLALKSVFAQRENTETLIFDEIDTGVSGKTSQKIGLMMRRTAECCQVVCVTHSAQIAAAADNQLYIAKATNEGRAETTVTTLDAQSRINEIARIMGGTRITEKLLETAREMIDQNKGENLS
jgi:DNA repair protein RecN (Recombination protein N)